MKAKTTWQKCYDIESKIEYLGEKNPGEHYFRITRLECESFSDPEDDECFIYVEDGKLIDVEDYDTYPSECELDLMENLLKEKNILK
jgi:hypothetical protein